MAEQHDHAAASRQSLPSPAGVPAATPAMTSAAYVPSAAHAPYLPEGISPRRQAFNRAVVGSVDGLGGWMRRHWLALVNLLLFLFIGTSALVPLGYAVGLTGPSSAIFNAYHLFCAQTPSHSLTIEGYQMCLCARCLAIYSSLLVGGLLLALLRSQRTVRALPWWGWALAMVPMALDGGTQLFGWRESNLELRLLTGAIFGLATAFFMLPQIELAARDPQPAPAPVRMIPPLTAPLTPPLPTHE